MKVAVIGSRNIRELDLERYIPADTCEIVSGGAVGVDKLAEEYAKAHGIPVTVFLPEYKRFGRAAPLKRNEQIVDYADLVIAFWNGRSRGTKYTIEYCRRARKSVTVHMIGGVK